MKTQRLLASTVFVWFALSPGASSIAAELPATVNDLQETLDAISATQEKISSIGVEYRVGSTSGDSKDYVHRVVALAAPSSIYHSNAHGNDRVDWHDDPFYIIARVTADRWVVERVNSRLVTTGALKATDPPVGSLVKEWFFFAMGIWPLKTRPCPRFANGSASSLLEIVSNPAGMELRPQKEMVSGRLCRVLVCPGGDVHWFDMERGAALMAREIKDPNDPGKTLRRFIFENLAEVKPGIWLPSLVRDLRIEGSGAKEWLFHMQNWRVNDVPDEQFNYTVADGALWLNPPDGKARQIGASSAAYFDRLITVSRQSLGSPPARSMSLWPVAIGLMVYLVMIACCLAAMVRRRLLRIAARGPKTLNMLS